MQRFADRPPPAVARKPARKRQPVLIYYTHIHVQSCCAAGQDGGGQHDARLGTPGRLSATACDSSNSNRAKIDGAPTPFPLARLARAPTVNLTAGCAHECCYCYARGYRLGPPVRKVAFYTNTLDKLGTSCDVNGRSRPSSVSVPRRSVPAGCRGSEHGLRRVQASLGVEIGVVFLTKGRIPKGTASWPPTGRWSRPDRTGDARSGNRRRVGTPRGGAGGTAGGGGRVDCVQAPVEARLDPILPGVTDGGIAGAAL